MEWETYEALESVLASLKRQEIYASYEHLKSRTEMMKMELRFLKMLFRGLVYWEELEYEWRLRSAINTMDSKVRRIARGFLVDCRSADSEDTQTDLEAVMYDFEKSIHEQIWPHAKDVCVLLLGGDYKCEFCPAKQKEFLRYGRNTASLIDLIMQNLSSLFRSNFIAPLMKQQIVSLQMELEKSGTLVDPSCRLFDLVPHSRAWSNRVSCITYLYWIDGNDEGLVYSMEFMLSGLLHKTMPCFTSGVISSTFPRTIVYQPLTNYLDFLLEELVIHMEDDIAILHEGLIFLLSFIFDPPDEDDFEDGGMIWAQMYATISEFSSLVCSIRYGEMKGVVFIKASLSDFMLKIDSAKAKVKNLYAVTPYSPQFTSPSTDAIGFLNSLIEYLKEMLMSEVNLISCLKHLCEQLQIELVSLRPVLKHVMDHEQRKIQDLCTRIINLVYNADYVIKFCQPGRFSAWYGVVTLPDVIEQIRLMKIEINQAVGAEKMHIAENIDNHLKARGTTSDIERASIGFIKDERVIIDALTRGHDSLTIISVSGSGGRGKTTFAKRIYNNSNVKCRFQKSVWCYVSKDCHVKELLAQILFSGTKDDGVAKLGVQDLVELVRKSLKGRRYLIVMDDIWDVYSWGKLESSFPDDKNGSRILFTSRNHDLASQVKAKSISHPLPLLSHEEGWELIRSRVFGSNSCDEELAAIGKTIANYCKGLPLAVALTAAILEKTEKKLDSWIKVAENLKTHLAEEGCGNVIELSYKYLADHLKSCFLYFGAFPRGKNVGAKKLNLLWIGEGFIIQNGDMQCSEEDLATEYLKDLVSQGLVVVNERGSMGEIKRCNLHDLLYDLCLEKCKEDKFLYWADESIDEYQKYNHHRLRIGVGDPFINSNPVVNRRELPASPLHSFLWSAKNSSYYAGSKSSILFLGSLKFVTVLSLKLRLEENKFPEVILSSIYLRHLALYLEQSIRAIPPEIANLKKLRTLIVYWRFHGFTYLPISMWKIKSLRHVDVKSACLDLEDYDPKKISKLFGASNIETLGLLNLNEADIADFREICPNVRKLKCQILQGMHIFTWFSMIGFLTQLESLRFTYDATFDWYSYYRLDPIVLKFPEIESLKKLSLDGLLLPWRVVSLIGKKLPNLQVLKLFWDACEGQIWELEDGGFSKLVYLKLTSLQDIVEIDFSSCEDDPFPCLEHLVLEDCCRLEEIPLVLGENSTLKTIEVIHCPKKLERLAMEIMEQQIEYGNDNFQAKIKSRG